MVPNYVNYLRAYSMVASGTSLTATNFNPLDIVGASCTAIGAQDASRRVQLRSPKEFGVELARVIDGALIDPK